MDISSLLTPQDPPAHHSSPSPQSRARSSNNQPDRLSSGSRPRKSSRRRAPPSPLRHQQQQQQQRSQQPQQDAVPPSAGRRRSTNAVHERRGSQSLLSPMDLSMTSPGFARTHFGRNSARLLDMNEADRKRALSNSMAHRPASASASASAMDTLAEIAYMQRQHHHESSRINSGHVSDDKIYEAQRAKSAGYNIDTLPKTIMTSADDDAHTGPLSKTLQIKSLTNEEMKLLGDLALYLSDNPYAFASHVQLINLLHTGFTRHTETASPNSYELLSDLRRARESMNFRFSLGEDLLHDWIEDECFLAHSVEERIQVVELCLKALEDEPCSALLWKQYGNWLHRLWSASKHSEEPASSGEHWSEEDKLLGQEFFKWEMVVQAWQDAVNATQWQMNSSHLVFDRYVEILVEDHARSPTLGKVRKITDLFLERVTQPHANMDNTFQLLSRFMSDHGSPEAYEETMMAATHISGQAKQQYSLRQGYETVIEQAAKANDKDAEWAALLEYLEWEMRTEGTYSLHLVTALYERATLRFSTDAELWEDYVDFLIEKENPNFPVLSVSRRGARHCPWSGRLWSKYVLELESVGKDFREIENVKHRATQTGLLDAGGMEELLKFCVSWCGYLLRKAFASGASEDDSDIAEVGIRSALEHVKQIGQKRYGSSYRGDPMYRLERIYIKFLARSGNIDAAREYWRSLSDQHADSYEFWWHYYMWEMGLIDSSVYSGREPTGGAKTPQFATEALRRGLSRVQTMDWPEKLIELFRNHCEQYESVQELRLAEVGSRKAMRQVSKRRQQEAADAAAAAALEGSAVGPAVPLDIASTAVEDVSPSGKRKREADEAGYDEGLPKKHKSEGLDNDSQRDGTDTSKLKRNREQTTIMVKKLPSDTTERRVRHFFRDCGNVISIKMSPGYDAGFQTATVEFESPEDALFAQTKETKKFDGECIQISLGTFSTLFVTNFPPQADENFIRDLFSPYGNIIDIRFPSLKYNTHRRFCYVQFEGAEQAQAATELDGKALQGNFALVTKISDPGRKKDRSGATQEGREVYVGNLDWKVEDEELREFFEPFGTLENVRIPRNVGGKSKGVGFVTFSKKDEAENAVKERNLKQFHDRVLQVSVAVPKNAKRMATTIVHSASPEPSTIGAGADNDTNNNSTNNNSQGGDISSATPAPSTHPSSSASIAAGTRRERTIALLNIPDTVSDARVRALVEPHGALRKIILRPDHQGAIIEFQSVQDVGKAALALEGREIVPDKPKITVGTVEELLRSSGRTEDDRSKAAREKKARSGKQGIEKGKGGRVFSMAQSALVSRPSPLGLGSRRGGKGGLGQRRGGGIGGGRGSEIGPGRAGSPAATSLNTDRDKSDVNATEMERNTTDSPAAAGSGGKSNAFFRSLLKKEEPSSS